MNTKNYTLNTAATDGVRPDFTYLADFHWAVVRELEYTWLDVARLWLDPAQPDGTREYAIEFIGAEENLESFAFEANALAERLATDSNRWGDMNIAIDFANKLYQIGSYAEGWLEIPFETFYDKHGYDADGYDENGYDEEGLDRDGEAREGHWLDRDRIENDF